MKRLILPYFYSLSPDMDADKLAILECVASDGLCDSLQNGCEDCVTIA